MCIDRFGYMKAMDEAAFVRASDEAKQEYPHIIKMKNTDKVCLFTDQGNMHQVRADRIPKCKIKDKGALVHTLCKLSGDEEALLYIPFEPDGVGRTFWNEKGDIDYRKKTFPWLSAQ